MPSAGKTASGSSVPDPQHDAPPTAGASKPNEPAKPGSVPYTGATTFAPPVSASAPSGAVAAPAKATAAPNFKYPPRSDRPYYWRLLGLDTAADILSWRPGRKAGAFALFAAVAVGGYVYDRREARRITDEAKERVAALSERPVDFNYVAPRLTILSTVLPDDQETERGRVYFKRYIKPVLVAAGLEFEYVHGERPGGLGRTLIGRFRQRRLVDAAEIERPASMPTDPQVGQAGFLDASAQQRELEAGTVVVGRSALKEYLWALRRGYLDDFDLERESRIISAKTRHEGEDEELARVLQSDSAFDEPDQPSPSLPDPAPPGRSLPGLPALSQQPPLLLVPYIHPLGSPLWWPLKWWRYLYGERHRARDGASLALRLVDGYSRPLTAPASPSDPAIWNEEAELSREWLNEKRKMRSDLTWFPPQGGSSDLDFGADQERYYARSFRKWPANIAQARKMYYDELAPKLLTARELARGDREPTKAETSHPPPTENDLRADRLDHEKRWRRNLEGWRVVRQGAPTVWDDERMRGKLRVFCDAAESDGERIVR